MYGIPVLLALTITPRSESPSEQFNIVRRAPNITGEIGDFNEFVD